MHHNGVQYKNDGYVFVLRYSTHVATGTDI